MADIDWPNKVPPPLKSGRSVEDVEGFLQSDVQAGPPISEVLSADTPSYINFQLLLTKGQNLLFQRWLRANKMRTKPVFFNLPVIIDDPNTPTQEAMFVSGGYPQRGTMYSNGAIGYSMRVVVRKIVDSYEDYDEQLEGIGDASCNGDVLGGSSILDEAINGL